jgi:hypothetical protein
VKEVVTRVLWAEPRRLYDVLLAPRGGRVVYLVAAIGAVAVAVTWFALRIPAVAPLVRGLTAYRADESWRTTALRLPLSALAPTQHLPVGGAVLQVFVALALAGAILGWQLAVLIGLTANVVASLITRAVLTMPEGPGDLHPALRHALDTGPSVVFVSLLVCALIASRCTGLAVTFVVGLSAVSTVGGPLATDEHAAGALLGLSCGLFVLERGFGRLPSSSWSNARR